MSTPAAASRRFELGPMRFDSGSGELAGPSGVHRIAPQPASLLALLAARPGEVVTRDEIREHLWPGGKVEFEQGIAFALREVRKAVEAAGGDPAIIETIPKRGFRLLVGSSAAAPAASSSTGAPTPAPPPASVPAYRQLLHLTALVPALVVIALVSILVPSTGSLRAVAVFPHEVEAPGQAGLASTLGIELTTALTRELEGRLGVVGPTGTAGLGGPDDTDGARDALGACLVVSGGIRAVGPDSIVVFTQIVRTSDRVHVWARLDTVALAVAAEGVVPGVVAGVEEAAGGC